MKEGNDWPAQHDPPACDCWARWVNRPVARMVSRSDRQGAMSDRRHLVADGDRRHFDFADARCHPTKPGSATLPFFGVKPALVDDEGNVIEGNEVSGNLCMLEPWLVPDAHGLR